LENCFLNEVSPLELYAQKLIFLLTQDEDDQYNISNHISSHLREYLNPKGQNKNKDWDKARLFLNCLYQRGLCFVNMHDYLNQSEVISWQKYLINRTHGV
jgi:hypothetical protein